MDMCVDTRIDMCVDIHIDKCVDTDIDMCVDVGIDMCADTGMVVCIDPGMDTSILSLCGLDHLIEGDRAVVVLVDDAEQRVPVLAALRVRKPGPYN